MIEKLLMILTVFGIMIQVGGFFCLLYIGHYIYKYGLESLFSQIWSGFA